MIGMCYIIKSFNLVPITKVLAGQGETTLTQAECDAYVLPKVQELFDKQKDLTQWENRPLTFKKRVYSYIQGKEPLPGRVITDPEPIRPNNKDFKKRSAAGEIVLSGFKNWQAVINYTNGGEISRSIPNALREYYGGDQWFPALGDRAQNGFLFFGENGFKFRIDTVWDFVEYKAERTPYELGWIDPTILELNDFISSRVVKASMVTETLADHNGRTVDMLTSMAEMPETVQMIMDAIKECLRLYIAVKRKTFRLQNKVAEWKNAKTSDKTRRQILRNIHEANEAIASTWLTYRYGIMPNVYLIEDALEALNAPKTLFLRDRSRNVEKVAFLDRPNWGSPEVEVTDRVMVKSRLQNDNKINSQLSASLTVTAWELIPLSFVIDWFINIGDVLAATWPTAHAEQGTTYSWKSSFTTQYKHEPSGALVTIQYNGYKRIVIDPLQFCKLEWNPYIDNVRTYDAIALSWKLFIESKFRKLS